MPLIWIFAVTLGAGVDPAEKVFENQVRPLLHQHCLSCHGPEKQKGGLRLDSAQAMEKGGDNGPVIDKTDWEKGLFVRAIRYEEDLKMPPAGKLKPAEKAILEGWIKKGAPWPRAIAAMPPDSKGPSPTGPGAIKTPWWVRKPPSNPHLNLKAGTHPIDHFLDPARSAKGLTRAPEARPGEILRRLSYDLTGLPPTWQDVRRFEADPSPAAFSREMDRMLESPAYGEKWGRKWLDLVRYADSNGMDENLCHGPAWRYRDWVIGAFNQDLPYDQFLSWQVAGDLLDPVPNKKEMVDRIIATGFLSIGPKMLAEDDPVKMRMDIIDEQIDTIGQAFMGLTLGCARCHDHKFDPLTMADYYALAGIFKSTETMETYSVVARWRERPLLDPSQEAQYRKDLEAIQKSLKELEAEKLALQKKRLLEESQKVPAYFAALKEWESVRSSSSVTQPGPDSLILEAEDYAVGNVIKDRETYGVGIGVLVNRGELPNHTEYTVNLTRPGFYRVWLRYAAAEARPVRWFLEGKPLSDLAATQATGSWMPDGQRWFAETVVRSPEAKVTLKLHRDGPFPHIDKIAFEHFDQAPPPRDPTALAKTHGLEPALFLGLTKKYEKRIPKAPGEILEKGQSFSSEVLVGEILTGEQIKQFEDRKSRLLETKKQLDQVPLAMAVQDGKVEDVPIHIRGNHLTLGRKVQRGFPGFIQLAHRIEPSPRQSGRKELAAWLTQPDHPLTARVMVNRIWQGHFGKGLVRSVDNFGNLGEEPSHPELLDWLAGEFVRSGWSIKAMHRLILTSQAWRQSVVNRGDYHLKDPDNRMLWRMDRRRLDAEEFRDSLLFVSGQLDRTMGGTLLKVQDRAYVTSTANMAYDSYQAPKRSVYLPVVRSALYDFFQVYDFPDPSAIHGERSTTVVPTQALFLLNGKLLEESAVAVASQTVPKQETETNEAIASLIRKVFLRDPRPEEVKEILAFLGNQPREKWKGLCRVILSSNEFLYVE